MTEICSIICIILLIVLISKINTLQGEVERLRKLFLHFQQKNLTEIPAEKETPSPVTPPESVPENTAAVPPSPAPVKAWEPLPVPEKPVLSPTEQKSYALFRRIWNWFIVGEEFRNPNVSREYAVATTWLLRGAFLLLLFGLAYFVKFAHDRSLVPPEVRLIIAALVSGSVMILGGCLKREKWKLFGSTLCGGGFAGLYLVCTGAVHLYHIISPSPGLWLLVILTAAGVLLSLHWNRMFLALLAFTGGYLAPVLMSTGSNNIPALFAYMTILTLGVLAVSMIKPWYLLRFISFLFTWGLFLCVYPDGKTGSISLYLIYGLVFFLIFTLLAVGFNLIHRKEDTLPDIWINTGNTAVYAVSGIALIVNHYSMERAGLFCAGLAVLHILLLNGLLRRKAKINGQFWASLILASALLALGLALMLERSCWGLAWTLQCLVTLFLGTRLSSRFTLRTSYACFCLTGLYVFCWMVHSYDVYNPGEYLERLLNTGAYVAGLLLGSVFLSRSIPPRNQEAGIFRVMAVILFFLASTAEVYCIFGRLQANTDLIAISVLWVIYALLFVAGGIWKGHSLLRRTGLWLFGITCVKLFLIDLADAPALYRIAGCMIAGLLMMGGAWLYTRFRSRFEKQTDAE